MGPIICHTLALVDIGSRKFKKPRLSVSIKRKACTIFAFSRDLADPFPSYVEVNKTDQT